MAKASKSAESRDGLQFLLPSGRGVRLLELTPSQKDEVERLAAKEVGKDGTGLDFRYATLRRGVAYMLKEISVAKGYKTNEDLLAAECKWKKLDLEELEDKYDEYFTSKDDAVLSNVYRKLHEVSSDDVDAIMGKAQPVAY